jgi:ATP-binding cassette subfamily F protein 3
MLARFPQRRASTVALLTVDDVQKHFGAQAVLVGASMKIDPGAKVGLVGRNGGGKSTLLRLIEGLDAPDWGRVTLSKGARLGHVEQRPAFPAGMTVRGWVEAGLDDVRRATARLEHLAVRMGEVEGDELQRVLDEHEELTHRVELAGGWEIERRVETVLGGIGLAAGLWDREVGTLSGGEQSRTALARALVSGYDLLLLDEPTNHLDLAGIEWLEGYVREIPTAVLIVSHDRRLLTNAVDAIFDLERGALTRYPGSYPKYLTLKQERYRDDLRAWEQQSDAIRKEQSFIKKHIGGTRTGEAKGRQRKLANVVRLTRPFDDIRRPVIRPPKAERGGERVLETEGLRAASGERVLFEDVNLRIGRGERIGIVGPNGAGKTTLLKLIAGRGSSLQTGGEVHYGHRAECGYYDQDTSRLDDDATPYVQIRRARPEFTDQQIRSHLAQYLFRGNDIDAEIRSLSGGERARLCLALLTLGEPSWLALDEPTNHLDLASRTALEEMLGTFQGALVCVSHDREFLDGLVHRIIEVAEGGVRSYDGNYSAWRAARLAETTASRSRTAKPAPAPTPKAAPAAQPATGKVRNPFLFKKLEERIMELEQESSRLEQEAATEEVYRDAELMKANRDRAAEVERELEAANEEWENWETA